MRTLPDGVDKSNFTKCSSTPMSRLSMVEERLASGFSFGPNKVCVACDGKITDPDSIDVGICPTCRETIRIRQELQDAV
jgi:hypothetical protein